jgi:hypothetical protein
MIYRILNRASAFQLDQNAFRFLKRLEICVSTYHYRKVENTNLILYYLNQPRLPPTEASTIDSRVVGTLMKSTPRLKVDARNHLNL